MLDIIIVLFGLYVISYYTWIPNTPLDKVYNLT